MATSTRKRTRKIVESDDELLAEATPKRVLRLRTRVNVSSGDVEIAVPSSLIPGTKSTRRSAAATPKRVEKLAKNVLLESSSQIKVSCPLVTEQATPSKQRVLQTPSSRLSKRPNGTPGTPRTPSMIYQDAKALFRRCTTPSRLVGREIERKTIYDFWEDHAIKGKAGALYISGIPGTGKTAMLDEVIATMQDRIDEAPHALRIVKFNCMTVKDPKKVYAKLLMEIRREQLPSKEAAKILESIFVASESRDRGRTFYVLVLDEIDSLITKDQEVLYRLFEWAVLPNSRLALIGIANALDLIDRFLPRLKAKNCEPQLLNFNPYEVKDIAEIIKQRLQCLYEGDDDPLRENMLSSPSNRPKLGAKADVPLMHPMAIELCARKMAGTGDLRKALDVCRAAIELAEAETRRKALCSVPLSPTPRRTPGAGSVGQNTSTVDFNLPVESLTALPIVTVKHILSATNHVFGSSNVNRIKGLSLQLKMILCTLVVMTSAKKADMSFGKLHETYVRICNYRRTELIPVTKTELQDLLTNLESAGLLSLVNKRGAGRATGDSMAIRNIELSVRPEEIANAVTDLPLLVEVLKLDMNIVENSKRSY